LHGYSGDTTHVVGCPHLVLPNNEEPATEACGKEYEAMAAG
jgi:hypothetical protein